jgi:hypothetical protein
LEKLPGGSLIFYPQKNDAQVLQKLKDQAAHRNIGLCPVRTMAEAMERLGILPLSLWPWRLVFLLLLLLLFMLVLAGSAVAYQYLRSQGPRPVSGTSSPRPLPGPVPITPKLDFTGVALRPQTMRFGPGVRLATGTPYELHLEVQGVDTQVCLFHDDGSTIVPLLRLNPMGPPCDNQFAGGSHLLAGPEFVVRGALRRHEVILVGIDAFAHTPDVLALWRTLETQLLAVASPSPGDGYTGPAREALRAILQKMEARPPGFAYHTLHFEHIPDGDTLARQAGEAMQQCRYAEAGQLLATARDFAPDHPEVQRLGSALREAQQRDLALRVSFIQWRGSKRPEALRSGTTLSPAATLSLYVQPERDCMYVVPYLGGTVMGPDLQSPRANLLRTAQLYAFSPTPEVVLRGLAPRNEKLCLLVSKHPLPDTPPLQTRLRQGAALPLRQGAPIRVPTETGKNVVVPSFLLQASGEQVLHCLTLRIPGRATPPSPPPTPQVQAPPSPLPPPHSVAETPVGPLVPNTPREATGPASGPILLLSLQQPSGPVSMRADVRTPSTYTAFKDAIESRIEQWLEKLAPRLQSLSPAASLTITLTLRDALPGSRCSGPGVQATLQVHVVDAPKSPASTVWGCDPDREVAIAKALCYLHPPDVYPPPCRSNVPSPEAWGMFTARGTKTQVDASLR